MVKAGPDACTPVFRPDLHGSVLRGLQRLGAAASGGEPLLFISPAGPLLREE
jgi:hypothetical protein